MACTLTVHSLHTDIPCLRDEIVWRKSFKKSVRNFNLPHFLWRIFDGRKEKSPAKVLFLKKSFDQIWIRSRWGEKILLFQTERDGTCKAEVFRFSLSSYGNLSLEIPRGLRKSFFFFFLTQERITQAVNSFESLLTAQWVVLNARWDFPAYMTFPKGVWIERL